MKEGRSIFDECIDIAFALDHNRLMMALVAGRAVIPAYVQLKDTYFEKLMCHDVAKFDYQKASERMTEFVAKLTVFQGAVREELRIPLENDRTPIVRGRFALTGDPFRPVGILHGPADQPHRIKGLREDVKMMPALAGFGQEVSREGIAGEKKDLRVGAELANPYRRFDAAQGAHHDVGDDPIGINVARDINGFFTAPRREHRKFVEFQDGGKRFEDAILIINNENGGQRSYVHGSGPRGNLMRSFPS